MINFKIGNRYKTTAGLLVYVGVLDDGKNKEYCFAIPGANYNVREKDLEKFIQ